jgi:hypothetical protein
MRLKVVLSCLFLANVCLAQQSPSYKMTETVFNEAGIPTAGVVLASPSYRITFGGAGEAIVATELAGASYRMDASFVGGYSAPGEVANLRFASKTGMTWESERSAGAYNVYRGVISGLSGLGYGTCYAMGLTTPTSTDSSTPSAGGGWIYLATAENRLGEEGTKGTNSAGLERPNPSPCP